MLFCCAAKIEDNPGEVSALGFSEAASPIFTFLTVASSYPVAGPPELSQDGVCNWLLPSMSIDVSPSPGMLLAYLFELRFLDPSA